MSYLVRNAKISDLQKIVDLCEQHAIFEKSTYNPLNKEEQLKKAIFSNQPQLYCLVIEVNNKVIGYTTYTFDYSTWDAQTFLYLDCLYLEPDFRHLGIGRAIFEKLKSISQNNNCVNMQWQTPTFNESAIQFYHKMGGVSKEKVRFSYLISN